MPLQKVQSTKGGHGNRLVVTTLKPKVPQSFNYDAIVNPQTQVQKGGHSNDCKKESQKGEQTRRMCS